MKNFKYLAVAILVFSLGNTLSAQIKANQLVNDNAIPVSSAFMDASVTASVNNINQGKGLIFPRADLTQLVLANQGTLYNTGNNPNRFDGMIVFNTATGTTPASGSGIGGQTVSPGFYYFSNPGTTSTLANGRWIAVGADTKYNMTTTEIPTAIQVEGAQVYGIKGQFTTTGTSTSVTIPAPAGMTSLYGITIYKKSGTGNKVVYSKELYSYDVTTGAAITGSQSMSVVYPQDTYDYVLEYFK
ncbi:hypothetical protein [Chryseobacterium gambrini]|uniref:Uncharacterized protein n=1 Tax=Chryseobacterium gambrini TaxID=373672 RepID=A0ABM8K592_9FLAO|nr:hypothetical protein CRDW_15070 [Chryseobacterium gambrini]